METDENAFAVVTYYSTVARPKLNLYADERDMVSATRAINGGTNGLPDRQAYYDRAIAEGDNLLDPEPLDELEAILIANELRPSQSHFARTTRRSSPRSTRSIKPTPWITRTCPALSSHQESLGGL